MLRELVKTGKRPQNDLKKVARVGDGLGLSRLEMWHWQPQIVGASTAQDHFNESLLLIGPIHKKHSFF
jgi:hypothetical protein